MGDRIKPESVIGMGQNTQKYQNQYKQMFLLVVKGGAVFVLV